MPFISKAGRGSVYVSKDLRERYDRVEVIPGDGKVYLRFGRGRRIGRSGLFRHAGLSRALEGRGRVYLRREGEFWVADVKLEGKPRYYVKATGKGLLIKGPRGYGYARLEWDGRELTVTFKKSGSPGDYRVSPTGFLYPRYRVLEEGLYELVEVCRGDDFISFKAVRTSKGR